MVQMCKYMKKSDPVARIAFFSYGYLEHLRFVVLLVVLGRTLAAWTSWTSVIAAWTSVVVTTWSAVVAAVVVTMWTTVSARLALRLDISLRLLEECLA